MHTTVTPRSKYRCRDLEMCFLKGLSKSRFRVYGVGFRASSGPQSAQCNIESHTLPYQYQVFPILSYIPLWAGLILVAEWFWQPPA